jgi:hypothetical protein
MFALSNYRQPQLKLHESYRHNSPTDGIAGQNLKKMSPNGTWTHRVGVISSNDKSRIETKFPV